MDFALFVREILSISLLYLMATQGKNLGIPVKWIGRYFGTGRFLSFF